jgi:hypothetical protein
LSAGVVVMSLTIRVIFLMTAMMISASRIISFQLLLLKNFIF